MELHFRSWFPYGKRKFSPKKLSLSIFLLLFMTKKANLHFRGRLKFWVQLRQNEKMWKRGSKWKPKKSCQVSTQRLCRNTQLVFWWIWGREKLYGNLTYILGASTCIWNVMKSVMDKFRNISYHCGHRKNGQNLFFARIRSIFHILR